MKQGYKQVETFTLEDWCAEFTAAYENSQEHSSSAVAWLELVEQSTTSIAELVRLEKHSELIEALGDLFGRLCYFVGTFTRAYQGEPFVFKLSLSDMIWHKYPGTCYRCTHKFTEAEVLSDKYLTCVCLALPEGSISTEDKDDRKQRKEQAREHKPRPSTLDGWTDMTRIIYGPNHREYGLGSICLHFIEEVGEVTRELLHLHHMLPSTTFEDRDDFLQEMQDEIADVFSWTMGLLNKIDQILEAARSYYASMHVSNLPPIRASLVAKAALDRARSTMQP